MRNSSSSVPIKQFRALAAACTMLVLTACSSTSAPPSAQSSNGSVGLATTLCASNDLDKVAQRALLAGGYYALQNKELACAERLTAQARKLDANDPYAALNLDAIYERQGRAAQAKALYAEAIALDPKGEHSEAAVEATTEKAKRLSPGQIAKRNLALLESR